MKKQKTHILIFAIFGVMALNAFLWGGGHKSSAPKQTQLESVETPISDEVGQNNDSENKNSKQAGVTVQSRSPRASQTQDVLLRFNSEASKTAFIRQNNITLADLEFYPNINVFSLPKAKLITANTAGTTVFEQKTYQALLTPNDTFYGSQWHLSKVNALPAWNNTLFDDSTTIAVIDTGFALEHEDLDDKWLVNIGEQGSTENEGPAPNCTSRGLGLDMSCNNLDDDADGYVDNVVGWDFDADDNSVQAGETNPVDSSATHGTFVAGLAAAESSNSQGVSGVSWGSRILPLQALSDAGEGYTVSVALAIRYAVDAGAQIINMSLGSDGDDELVAEQIDYAIDQGVTVVAAAGNDGVGQLSYPANYPGVIAVGATDSSDNRASFSNYGANLSLVAPGTSSICSTAWSNSNQTHHYVCGYSGTSFSSPIVAGAAALLLSQNPTLNPAQVKTALQDSAAKLPGMSGQNFTTRYGYGRLNSYEALKLVSLAAPTGHVLNTHTIKLSEETGIYRPDMNSTCTSYYDSAQCRVRAVNTSTNQLVWLVSELDAGADINSYWNAQSAGLGVGNWLVQVVAQSGGVKSLVREETLSIAP